MSVQIKVFETKEDKAFRDSVENGIKSADAGRVISLDTLEKKLSDWRKFSSKNK